MPNVLIYSPDLDGHRQVHLFVYAHILHELGFKLFIAGDFKRTTSNSYYINKLKEDKNITLKDTCIYTHNGYKITNKEFIELQKECEVDLTIFAEADNHIPLFTSQIFNKKKKLQGKTIGVFLRPFYFYRKLSFLDKLRFIKHLPSTWRYDNFLFHEYFLKQFKLLDSVLHFDENFVSNHAYSHFLPDVFQRYAEGLVNNENPEQRIWIDRLYRFKKDNKDKFIFFYFGTAQSRRGYDLLLKMAVDYNACFVHCGLNNEEEKYDFNISGLKNILRENGRLMETNQYISGPLCIEHFFKSIDHLVLPYRNFWGISSVMLQALNYNIPVLVSDIGLMGYLVKKYELGLVYDGNHTTSLFERFKQFEKLSSENFKSSIMEYMKYKTPERLKKILVNIIKSYSLT